MVFALLVLWLMGWSPAELGYQLDSWRVDVDIWVQVTVRHLFLVLLFGLIWTVVCLIIAVPLATVISAAGAVGGHSTPKTFMKWYATSGGVVWFIGVFVVTGLTALFKFSGI